MRDTYCPFTPGRCEEVKCGRCEQQPVSSSSFKLGGVTCIPADRVFYDGPPLTFAKPHDATHPQHYARWKMEPIEFIALNDLPWWLANVIKYGMRYDAKDGIQDLYKARSYLEMKIRQLEGHARFWEKPVAEQQLCAKHPIVTVKKA